MTRSQKAQVAHIVVKKYQMGSLAFIVYLFLCSRNIHVDWHAYYWQPNGRPTWMHHWVVVATAMARICGRWNPWPALRITLFHWGVQG